MSAPKGKLTLTLSELLADARSRLAAGAIDDPALEARMIVEHFTGTNRTDAIASPKRPVSDAEAKAVDKALARRVAGEPVHRIFGWRDFYGLRMKLSPATLEPRPDTETLVDAILPFLRDAAAREGTCKVLDLGTGTGAIALAIAAHVPGALVTATDISTEAMETATGNAEANSLLDCFFPLVSDWFSAVEGKFHAIVSNPPYIESDAIRSLQPEVRLHDPRRALDGGTDGLDAYRALAEGAAEHLEPDGRVAVEIGHGQRSDVQRMFTEAGYTLLKVYRDLAGTERVLMFCR
jgi:release factor glutamine methyltransferase